MVEEWINIRKLLSLVFFAILFFFLLYISFERVLSKREFRKKLRLAKDQLFFDIFKNDDPQISEFLTMDELSAVEVEIRQNLKELKKKIYCDTSRYDLKSLEENVSNNFREREKKLNKVVLTKYKDAIKSLNDKIVYLKHDLDGFKSVYWEGSTKVTSNLYNESQHNYVRLDSSIKDIERSLENKIDYILKNKYETIKKQIDYLIQNNDKITSEKMNIITELQNKNEKFMQDNMNKIYELVHEKDKITEEKSSIILEQKTKIQDLEQKLFAQTNLIETKLKQYSLDKEYMDQYISSIKKQTKTQSAKNTMFVIAMVILFMITITMFFLILTKSPIIYSLY